jgi:hypothetical protein
MNKTKIKKLISWELEQFQICTQSKFDTLKNIMQIITKKKKG